MKIFNIRMWIFLFCVLFNTEVLAQKKKEDYISLKLAFGHARTELHTIIFYCYPLRSGENSVLEERFKVSKKEFRAIAKVVRDNSSYIIIDSLADRYYDINLVLKGRLKIFGTVNLNKTKEVFTLILGQLKSSKEYNRISEEFEYLYSQLIPKGYKGNLSN